MLEIKPTNVGGLDPQPSQRRRRKEKPYRRQNNHPECWLISTVTMVLWYMADCLLTHSLLCLYATPWPKHVVMAILILAVFLLHRQDCVLSAVISEWSYADLTMFLNSTDTCVRLVDNPKGSLLGLSGNGGQQLVSAVWPTQFMHTKKCPSLSWTDYMFSFVGYSLFKHTFCKWALHFIWLFHTIWSHHHQQRGWVGLVIILL